MSLAAYYEGARRIRLDASVPVQPAPGEVRLRVSHCGICGTDLRIWRGLMDARVAPPRVIGHELAGVVEAAGPGVSDFAPGDRVAVMPILSCGACPACRAGRTNTCHKLKVLGIDVPGAFQEYLTVPARLLHRLPAGLPMDAAALAEPVAVACRAVRIAAVQPGEFVVVLGGGPIGMLTAMVAQHLGARVVLAGRNPERARLAADAGIEVVDAGESTLPALVEERTNGAGADVVFEATGTPGGAAMMTALGSAECRIVVLGLHVPPPPVDLFRFFWRELKLFGCRVYRPEDFAQAVALLGLGSLPFDRAITHRFPLAELPAALANMESGGGVMKTVILCSE